jgi:uncharacterized Zn-binding protein involved in type VI secretion
MSQPHTYILATIGAKTRQGGEVVTASSGMELIARVGDKVHYPDGSETEITSGAGALLLISGRPAAIVGSHLANGDRIVSSPGTSGSITAYGTDIEGLLQPGYRAGAAV